MKKIQFTLSLFAIILLCLSACKTKNENTADTQNDTSSPIQEESLISYFSKETNLKLFTSCGYNMEAVGNLIPISLCEANNLYKFENYKDIESSYSANSPLVQIKGLKKWMHQNLEILLYSITIGNEKTEIGGTEVRFLILDTNKKLLQNIFLAGNAYDEGESMICRTLSFTNKGIELFLDESENTPINFSINYHEILSLENPKDIQISKGELLPINILEKKKEISSVKDGLVEKNALKLNLAESKFVSSVYNTIDPDLCQLSQLQWLGFYRYNLENLPKEITCLSNLQYLDLGTNPNLNWTETFKTLSLNTYLKVLNLSENNLKQLPENIHSLVFLKELWLAGNNFNEAEQIKIKKMLPNVKVYFKYD